MLRRDKLVASDLIDDEPNTFYPEPDIQNLEPNARITLVEDPSLNNSKNYISSAVYSDNRYFVNSGENATTEDDVYTSTCGSFERLNETSPNCHALLTITNSFRHTTYLYTDEKWTSLYIYNTDYSSVASFKNLGENEPSPLLMELTDSGYYLSTGTYEWFLSNREVEKPTIQEPEFPKTGDKLHLEIDLTDDCQYIKVTHTNPVSGENTANFEVTAKGQNESGKYVYEIHWWGWFKQYYRALDENAFLMYFSENRDQNEWLNLLMKDSTNSGAEVTCIAVTPPLGAKAFDFVETVETDTTLHMAKYKDLCTLRDVTI